MGFSGNNGGSERVNTQLGVTALRPLVLQKLTVHETKLYFAVDSLCNAGTTSVLLGNHSYTINRPTS